MVILLVSNTGFFFLVIVSEHEFELNLGEVAACLKPSHLSARCVRSLKFPSDFLQLYSCSSVDYLGPE